MTPRLLEHADVDVLLLHDVFYLVLLHLKATIDVDRGYFYHVIHLLLVFLLLVVVSRFQFVLCYLFLVTFFMCLLSTFQEAVYPHVVLVLYFIRLPVKSGV